jgi:CheY-like chemotaxis protein
LCVDDDVDTSEVIELLLRYSNANYEIISVRTPEEALTLASAKHFDLYVLDHRYRDMTGVELCRSLRQANKTAPIMFFSGEARPAERQVALAAGANAYLVKPDDINKLPDIARQLLGAEVSSATM